MSAMHGCYLLPEQLYTSLQQDAFGTMHGDFALFKQCPKRKLFVHALLWSIQKLHILHEQLYTALETMLLRQCKVILPCLSSVTRQGYAS